MEVSTKKLSAAVSAFANTAGGDLYIGIAEYEFMGVKMRNWRGFVDQEAANGHIQSLEALFPLGGEYSYQFLRAPGSDGVVLHVQVQRTAQIAKAHGNKVYVRRGAQNLEVKGKALEQLRLAKGIESYEKQTVDVNLSALTESAILKDFVKQVVPNLAPKAFLQKQNLIRGNKPTVAALLLFAEEPQAALPKRSGIKLYRYKTTGAPSRDALVDVPVSIEGPMIDMIRKAVSETARMIEGIQKLGAKGLEPVVYPVETLHEIVTNAVLHRDYSIASDVHIRVFDNRVEVESPGILPGQVTVKNILDEQFARNGMLVRLINKFPNPPNKDVGEGLNTAFKAMQKLRLKPPVIMEPENSVLVDIRHDPMASPEESVMDYLANHAEIKNGVARALTGISSENSMKDVFLRLAKRNLIERVPNKKGASAAWQKKTPSPDLF
ncbi:MAG: putative DNA binding domain-containing protein [Gammaproteobacteria bacterium]|nr:putative DNA binding domain-containing protein [Gammaproteobacteria bacterium]MBU0787857.1 putative DNA binding domain-containing protein [Gammaproteobacteria bacterium]MBU0817025.1 putative DNA binding domain-containing protein [Gammaproteobacteria bacterium]MBU1787189.1 putative DNA binding domain-containing protein [Gammaproteobacteria bacterium]